MYVIREEEEIDSFGWDLGFIPGYFGLGIYGRDES